MRDRMEIVCDIMQAILTKLSNAKDIKNLKASIEPVAVRFTLDNVNYKVSGTLFVEEIQGAFAISSNNAQLMQDILRGDAIDYERVSTVVNALVNTVTYEQLHEMAVGLGWPDMESKPVLKRIFRAWLEKAVNEDNPQHHECQQALDIVWMTFGSKMRQRLASAIGKQFGFDYAKDVDHTAY